MHGGAVLQHTPLQGALVPKKINPKCYQLTLWHLCPTVYAAPCSQAQQPDHGDAASITPQSCTTCCPPSLVLTSGAKARQAPPARLPCSTHLDRRVCGDPGAGPCPHSDWQPWLSCSEHRGGCRQSGLQNNNHLPGLITEIFHTGDLLY